MSQRPQRIRVHNELGRPQSLPDDRSQYETIPGGGGEYIFLGLGPAPERIREFFPEADSAYYVETDDFTRQMPPQWREQIPKEFRRVQPEQLYRAVMRRATIVRYKPALRLFPDFWGPVWARCSLAGKDDALHRLNGTVWMPEYSGDLLGKELHSELEALGFAVELVEKDISATLLGRLLRNDRPDLFLSVNFKGLDPYGGIASLLREAGSEVAVWCVDNPFHLLTAMRSRYWTRLHLFVTDDWFIPRLKNYGADSVHHLPLAAAPHFLSDIPDRVPDCAAGIEERLVFVGRSQFPDKDKFFAGCSLPDGFKNEIMDQFDLGDRAGFDYWEDRLGVSSLWPGNDVRRIGYCAEETGRAWRGYSLNMAEDEPGQWLTVFGDDGWREALSPACDLRPVVDYYTQLPAISKNAACCLNLTSPLLPNGLTQRNFDVWAAGGLLITDNSPGLKIFPGEMYEEVCFARHPAIPAMFERLMSDTALARDLRAAWRLIIQEEHTYRHRVETLLDRIGMERP